MRSIVISTGILALLSLIFLQCKKSDSKEGVDTSTVQDTRELVRQAYANVDVMKIPATFIAERAIIIKNAMDGETDPGKRLNLELEYAFELLKLGKTLESIQQYERTYKTIVENNINLDAATKRNLMFVIGMAFMRHGEIENCVQNHNHESCFVPIKGGGIHTLTMGSTKAIKQFEAILNEFPQDLEAKYLLNIAYMTLGQYPEKVPAKWLINPAWFSNKVKMQPFKDIAPDLGLNRNARAGSVVFDDMNNDGWLDFVLTSWYHTDSTMLYINNGDGSFSDQSYSSGISGHQGSLHLNQTDFNNDGWLDLFILRGAWIIRQGDIPATLLMNTGKGTFEDVTLKAGLTKYGPSQAAAWADFNLDGWLDLVKANESFGDYQRGVDLYMNQKDGTFKHESVAWGLELNAFFKGCVAVDANNDRYPDIYLSSATNGNILLINQMGQGKTGFAQAGPTAPVQAQQMSFPCWNFDYDNDGWEDLFVSGFSNDGSPAVMWMQSKEGKADLKFLPKLYHNKGNLVFEDVSTKMGLNEIAFTMGCNFGDINTDGYLDFYLSTGNPLYQAIVPNKMYLNMEGRKFEDVSYSGGFGNIQKGHGVGFGDWDRDGDEDIYAVIGGAYDGDFFYNTLFDNPNEHNNHWVVLKLEGNTANRAAIGARVAISVQENGKERKIYRTVTSGASFGANSLQLEVGLRKADIINNVVVTWPCKDCPEEVFSGMEIKKAYRLTQGSGAAKSMPYDPVVWSGAKKTGQHNHQ